MTAAFFVTAFFCVVIPGYCANSDARAVRASAAAIQPDVRKLHFPDKSIGSLMLVNHREDPEHRWMIYSQGKQVGGARGDVSLTVPPGSVLMLDVNRRVFENPDLLKEVSPNGIDILRMSFMSMDDSEDHLLENAVPRMANLKGVKALFFDRSEVQDAEMSKVKNLPHLCAINFFLSGINGACFKDLAAFPELYEVDAPFCHINQRNIAGLAQIAKLRILDLSKTHMTLEGAKSLSKLPGLVYLDLCDNPKFDDECVKCLKPLSHLKKLDLHGTMVTMEGLKSLRGIKFSSLLLPARLRKNQKELSAMFPGTGFEFAGDTIRTPNKEDSTVFAPLR
jgi:hypothetical protein